MTYDQKEGRGEKQTKIKYIQSSEWIGVVAIIQFICASRRFCDDVSRVSARTLVCEEMRRETSEKPFV